MLAGVQVSHCKHSRSFVVVQDRLRPSSPCEDGQIRMSELDELRSLFLLACHMKGKILWYQGAGYHNINNQSPSLFPQLSFASGSDYTLRCSRSFSLNGLPHFRGASSQRVHSSLVHIGSIAEELHNALTNWSLCITE